MNLIEPLFEILEQESGIDGMLKAAELPGRICYGSMDKMTTESAKPFVDRLMKSNHGAPLEHGTVYLKVPYMHDNTRVYPNDYIPKCKGDYKHNAYSKVNSKWEDEETCYDYVTTNLRVLFENDWMDDLKYWCERTDYHEKRIMVRFTCNIGVTREYNRHRVNSINEESTRYCNYSKDKYNGQVSVIINNNKFSDRKDELIELNEAKYLEDYCGEIYYAYKNEEDLNFSDIDYWLFSLKASEWSYLNLINKCNWKQQDARDLLGLATKSSLIHTAFISDWKHFFDLRAKGTTGAPHPQAKELAYPLMMEFIERGYLTSDFMIK